MTDFNIAPFFDSSEPISLRHYVNDVASYMFGEALENVQDSAITEGFSKGNVLALARPIYDTSINMIQLSENAISILAQQGNDDLADLFRENAMTFMQINENTMARTFQSLINFDSMGTTVTDFLEATRYSDIFTEDLLDSFVGMGQALNSFNSLPDPNDPTLEQTMQAIENRIQELMYGSSLLSSATSSSNTTKPVEPVEQGA